MAKDLCYILSAEIKRLLFKIDYKVCQPLQPPAINIMQVICMTKTVTGIDDRIINCWIGFFVWMDKVIDSNAFSHCVSLAPCVLSTDSRNAEVLHTVGLLPKLLFLLSDPSVTFRKVTIICCVITGLLKGPFTALDLSRCTKVFHCFVLSH